MNIKRGELTSEELLIRATGSPRLAPFSRLVSFKIEYPSNDDPRYCEVRLVVDKEVSPSSRTRAHLRFCRVRNLELKEFGGEITQLTGLDVIDIQDWQWEGIRFQVVDYENDRIQFHCESGVVELVEEITLA